MHLLLAALLAWNSWHTSAIVQDHGYPVFTVDGKPFFVYGAAFFYERMQEASWESALDAYRRMGINTIDLYVMWNWHATGTASLRSPEDVRYDFTRHINDGESRDLLGLLALIHKLGLKVILRPGPVIRNEWRNGGYPDWLLERPEYGMPLHDVLEGRYPATATLQNQHADAAGEEWMHNPTHLRFASAWLHRVLKEVAPYSRDVIGIALDDDQGAYIDNDTWPAPHWNAYVRWLAAQVRSVTGPGVPLFVNTFEMKVPAASPAWAWGNWYQSDAYSIGAHDLAELDFATGLLQTQPHVPVMQAEFQAGWLQGADEAYPRPSDPTNTALALEELVRDGVHGVVNFPVQDTIDPDGWEAPWANWSYAWDAALTRSLERSPRYAPTAAFGRQSRRYGTLLAQSHPVADAAIIWPPTLFVPGSLDNAAFSAFADATIAAQRECSARHLTCRIVDLKYADAATLHTLPRLYLPIGAPHRDLTASAVLQLEVLRRSGKLVSSLAGLTPAYDARDATLLLTDDRRTALVAAIDPSDAARVLPAKRVLAEGHAFAVPAIPLGPRAAALIAVGLAVPEPAPIPTLPPRLAEGPYFVDLSNTVGSLTLNVDFGRDAGARISVFERREARPAPPPPRLSVDTPAPQDTGTYRKPYNFATWIGLLRDAVDPAQPPSARDYIAAYTHPIPAGTFNRPYTCTGLPGNRNAQGIADENAGTACRYDAPDLPAGGGRFERGLRVDDTNDDLVVDLRFTPHDPHSTARLQDVSGFAFGEGDTLIAPHGAPFLGILHGDRLAALRWRAADVARLELRRTRGAEIVALTFAVRNPRLHLAIWEAPNATEALRLLRANRPDSSP